MCPITMSIVAASTIAFAQAAAAGAGLAAAASAASAAAGAVTAGATVSAALTVGAGVASGAVTTATTSAFAVGGVVGAATPGATAGGAFTTGALLTEAVAFASIGQGVHQNKEAKRRAAGARKDASDLAKSQRGQAANEAARAVRAEAEIGAESKIEEAEAQGVVHNLQNRSDVQVATLSRQVEREQQGRETAASTRLEAVQGDVRSAFNNIQINENRARREAKDPSNLGLALSLGSTALGSALKTA